MSNKPLFVFFGTPRFAVRVLDALEANGLLPALVVTAPDKPKGRGLELHASPAKEWAQVRGIDVLTPATLRDDVLVQELANTDWDVFVVAAYAKLIPKSFLDMPRKGVLNVHPSLLPKFRGPSPARSAILEDARTTGVTIMQMDAQMDHGPIVAQARIELDEEAWPPKGGEFEDFLATEGGNLLAEVLPDWLAGNITPEAQNETDVTFSKKFTDDDAKIDPSHFGKQDLPAGRQDFLKIRAFDGNPRPYFVTDAGKRVIITEANFIEGVLSIEKVIPEGKKEMNYKDFLRGLTK